MFLYFLDKNSALFVDGKKKIEDAALVALAIMIAESRPEEKNDDQRSHELYAVKLKK